MISDQILFDFIMRQIDCICFFLIEYTIGSCIFAPPGRSIKHDKTTVKRRWSKIVPPPGGRGKNHGPSRKSPPCPCACSTYRRQAMPRRLPLCALVWGAAADGRNCSFLYYYRIFKAAKDVKSGIWECLGLGGRIWGICCSTGPGC